MSCHTAVVMKNVCRGLMITGENTACASTSKNRPLTLVITFFFLSREEASSLSMRTGNQQQHIIGCVFSVRQAVTCYFCFLTFCTLPRHHCRTLQRSELNNLDASELCDKTVKNKLLEAQSVDAPPLPVSAFLFSLHVKAVNV